MTNKRSNKRRTALVELVPGVALPERFTAHRYLSPRYTAPLAASAKDEDESDLEAQRRAGGWYEIEIVVGSDGVPRWVSRCEYAPAGGEPVSAVTDGEWRQRMEEAIATEAANVVAARVTGGEGFAFGVGGTLYAFDPRLGGLVDAPGIGEAVATARRAARPERGRPRISDDQKLEALTLFRKYKRRDEGIAAVMEATGKSERTVTRWISDAQAIERGV